VITPEEFPGPPGRRLSFGATAAEYDRYRPGYPAAVVDWVLRPAGEQVRHVVDVGAGTGALTRVLVRAGLEVTAVEPDPDMLARLVDAPQEIPPANPAGSATIRGLPGSAESIPLPDAGMDAAFAAQAWHWFDHPRAVPELARVLRPGGVLGLLWNMRDDSVPWMASLSDIVGGEDTMRAARGPDLIEPLLTGHFRGLERTVVPNPVRHTPASLVALVTTFSYVRLSPRADEVVQQVRELLATHPDLAGRAELELRYLTVAYRSVRA
jgi:SAM-dependent methyltransferase